MTKPLKSQISENLHPAFMSSERYPEGGRYAEILAQAAKLFARNGFSGASMQDLASAVGISKASLYHFFKDKEEIHSKVVIISLDRLNWLVDDKVAQFTTSADRIDAFCRAHAEHLANNTDLYIAAAMGYQAMTNAHVKDQARTARVAYEAKLRAIIQAGIDGGEFRPLDVALAARAIISCLNWMARWWKPDGPQPADEIASSYAALIIRGFLPDKG